MKQLLDIKVFYVVTPQLQVFICTILKQVFYAIFFLKIFISHHHRPVFVKLKLILAMINSVWHELY